MGGLLEGLVCLCFVVLNAFLMFYMKETDKLTICIFFLQFLVGRTDFIPGLRRGVCLKPYLIKRA